MLLRKILSSGAYLQTPLRSFVKHSRKLIYTLEEPFYRTSDPMATAILFGVFSGTLIFLLLKNSMH